MKFAISLQNVNQNPKYANYLVCFLHNSSNPNKNYFQDAVVKYQILTAVPSRNNVMELKCQIL